MADPTSDNPVPSSDGAETDPSQLAADALADATQAVQSLAAEAGAEIDGSEALQLPEFGGVGDPSADAAGIGLLDDVTLRVKIELGRTQMYVEDVLRLNANAVVELDKAAGDPVDIYVNERHVARGEVLVLNENFCVRISEIIQQVGTEE
jgi:flagellar motor switch protein FliN